MLSLTLNVDQGIWGSRVLAHVYDCQDDGRRVLVAEQRAYLPLGEDLADVDDLTALAVVCRQWAERLMTGRPFGLPLDKIT